MNLIKHVLASSLVLSGVTCSLLAININVAPDGEISTLQQARDKARDLRKDGELGDINIIINDGVYQLKETLILGLEDSAPNGAKTTFKAADGASPLISGGVTISGWVQSDLLEGKIWKAKVDWAKGDAFFHCLYDGNTLLPRARSNMFNASVEANEKKYAGLIKDRIHFSFDNNALKSWENIEDIEVYGKPTRKWLVNYLGLESVNEAASTAKLALPATYNMSGDEWYVENCIDHLDEPGEWALNSQEGYLYYYPASGKPGKQIIAPALNELIRVEGQNDPSLEGGGDIPVTGITFQGLTFSYADRQKWLPEDQGIQHDWNMWDKANGLIRFRGAKDCVVTGCTFVNSGSDGVRLDLFCQGVSVKGCTIKDIGGTGVLLSGYGPGKKDVNKSNTVHNNEITRVGQLFQHSPGVFIWQSGDNKISNNHVYDQAYTGMVIAGVRRRFFAPKFEEMGEKNPFGGQWLFPEGTREHIPTIRWDEISLSSTEDWNTFEPYMHARNNVIEFNEVHDCLKLLHDGNCIYLSGNGNGNIVRYNVTYNHPEGAMIRTDDDSHGGTVSNNLAFGTGGDQGIQIKGLNIMQNNLLINCRIVTGGAGNSVDPESDLSKNILYQTRNIRGGFYLKKGGIIPELDKNIYFSESGDLEQILATQRAKDPKQKTDLNSLAADPLFVDLKKGDFAFKPDSPAIPLGIQPFTTDILGKVGTSKDPFLKRFSEGLLK